MKPFVFRWQRILRLAEGFERESRNSLGQALGELTRAESVLDELHRRCDDQKVRRFNLLNEGADITDVKNTYQGEVEMEYKMGTVVQVIATCEENVEKRRQELTEKMRERKTYEILRTKALERHTTEMKREESRDVDEVASIAFGRTENDEII